MKYLLLMIFLALVLSGCASNTVLDDEWPEQPSFIGHGLCGQIEQAMGGTASAAKKRLGEPDHVEVERSPSPHDATFVNLRTRLDYKDGFLVFHYVPKTNLTFLEMAKFTKKFHPVILADFFTKEAHQRIAELGEPYRETSEGLEYPCDEMSDEGIIVKKSWGRVESIVLRMWVD